MNKTILAFDTASSSRSVAIFKDGKFLFVSSENENVTHSQTLLPSIKTALEENNLSVSDLDFIAVTNGPGSFTGLKIAVSTAKGLAFPENIPCFGVSTLSAIAYSYDKSEDRIIVPSLDARRNMLYNAIFKCENGEIKRLTPDRQISAEDLKNELLALGDKFFLSGDGSKILTDELKNVSGKDFRLDENAEIIDSRGIVKAITGENIKPVLSKELLPAYLRKPQAEREREEKLKGNIK